MLCPHALKPGLKGLNKNPRECSCPHFYRLDSECWSLMCRGHFLKMNIKTMQLVQEGSWWCRFTDDVVTPGVPLSAPVWADSCSELILYLLPDHGCARARERARITLQFKRSSRQKLYDEQPVRVNVHVSRMRRVPGHRSSGFSSRPADEMQTCMFL